MPRPDLPGRANAGLPTRIVLSALAGLLSLLVVIGLSADGSAFGGVPPFRSGITFEQRPDTDPVASVRSGHTLLDLDETASHGRVGTVALRPTRDAASAPLRPASDRNSAAAEHSRLERPPRG